MPLIPALGRQKQADLCEFETSLSKEQVSRQLGLLHRETLSRKTNRGRRVSWGVREQRVYLAHTSHHYSSVKEVRTGTQQGRILEAGADAEAVEGVLLTGLLPMTCLA